MVDTIPPAVPRNLKGTIDQNGKATLAWNLGTDRNIIGYRVLRANDPTHEFMQITGHIHRDTVFTDSVDVNTLSRHVYYKIAAVNQRNQHSGLSPALELRRPDRFPPGEAVFFDVLVTDTLVNLKWHCSSSEDVAKQLLFRKKETEQNWSLLDSLKPGVSGYTDRNVETSVTYLYTLASVDSAGLRSADAFPVLARPYDTGRRKPVANFTAAYNETSKTIVLNWNYTPEKKEKWWFVVYKSINGGEYKEYKSVEGSVNSFTDFHYAPGKTGYGLVVMTSFGGKSEMVLPAVENAILK
jgi:uncharacterized protein